MSAKNNNDTKRMTEQEPKSVSECCGNCLYFGERVTTYCSRPALGVESAGVINYSSAFYVADTYWCKHHKPTKAKGEK